jgi:hypothetical protein
MDYSEFIRQLGADPASRDPAFLRARTSSPEFERAAAESDRFERQLSRALSLNTPQDLLPELKQIGNSGVPRLRVWRNYALAAGVLLALFAAGILWRLNPEFDSVEQYVAYHYAEDGSALVARAQGRLAANVDEVLTRFRVGLTPEARHMVGLIKFCPTPGGKGAHMVFNTTQGPITVIFMPETEVTDGEMLQFDGMQAQLVALQSGSIAVIGTEQQQIGRFHTMMQKAFIPLRA